MTKRAALAGRTVLVLFLLFVVIYLVPYFWLISTSLKTRIDAFSVPPKILFSPISENFSTVLIEKNFLANFGNSILVTLAVTIISLAIGVPSAYAFSRFRMKGDRIFFFYLLGTRFTPVIVLALPLYFIMTDLRLLNTFAGIITAHSAFNIAFVIWMMKGFFDTVPKAIDESARVDGCNWFTVFFRIVLPLTGHGIAATSVFCAINSWNEFLMALILTGRKTATLPVALPTLMTPSGDLLGSDSRHRFDHYHTGSYLHLSGTEIYGPGHERRIDKIKRIFRLRMIQKRFSEEKNDCRYHHQNIERLSDRGIQIYHWRYVFQLQSKPVYGRSHVYKISRRTPLYRYDREGVYRLLYVPWRSVAGT